MRTETVQPNLVKGSLFVLIAFFCMAVFGLFTKSATLNSDAQWISFITYSTATLCLIPYVLSKGLNFLKTKHFAYHVARSVFGLTASFLYMISMHYIPIVNATLLFNTAPIFIPIIATLWLNEDISKRIWLGILIGFIGIIIIIQPSLAILSQSGDFIALASGICLAIAYLLIQVLTPTDAKFLIIFYFFFLSTCLQIPLLLFAGNTPNLYNFSLAAMAGLSLLLAQVFLVQGYQYATASQVGIYQYTSVIFVGLMQWLFWGITPNLTTLLGTIVVIIAAYIIIRSK